LRHGGRRAWLHALRRPAATCGARTSPRASATRPDPGRRHLVGRPDRRGRHPGRASSRAVDDADRGRLPALHDPPRRPRDLPGERRGQGHRPARGPARPRAGVRRDHPRLRARRAGRAMSAVVELLADDEDAKVPEHLKGAFAVLGRGIKESPELRTGLGFTVIVSLGVTVASLVTPVLVQQIFDKGFAPTFNARFVYGRCAAAFLLVVLAFLAARAAGRRLVRASENALMHLRVRTVRDIHALSIAEEREEQRCGCVCGGAADGAALQEIREWGGIAWIISGGQAIVSLLLIL